MWIVYFNGAPSLWLLGGELYRAGKRECHIAIKDDRSISRTHLSIDVGLPSLIPVYGPESSAGTSPQPSSLTLIDSSTYGTVVFPVKRDGDPHNLTPSSTSATRETGIVGLPQRAVSRSNNVASSTSITSHTVEGLGEQHTLTKGTPFRVPVHHPDYHEFSVVLGNHGATLTFVWADLTVLVEHIDSDQATKIAHQLNKCGVRSLRHGSAALLEADFFMTDVLRPSAAAFAMLCRSVPIVRPDYFRLVRDRPSPQVPLPDPSHHMPPLDPSWRVLWPVTDTHRREEDTAVPHAEPTEAADAVLLQLLSPHPPRQHLFAGITFVVVQHSLYTEVSQYIGCAAGRVELDESLANITNAPTRERLLPPFVARHHLHVLLYSAQDRLPFRGCLAMLQGTLQLCTIEYGQVIESILKVQPLQLPPFPPLETTGCVPGGLVSTRTSRGTADGEAVLFPSMNLAPMENAEPPPFRRHVSEDGWVSVEPEYETSAPRGDRTGQGCDLPTVAAATAATPAPHPFQLPRYPCFTPYPRPAPGTADAPNTTDEPQDGGGVFPPHKRFKKQALAPATVTVQLCEDAKVAAAADLLASHVPPLDDDSIIPTRAALLQVRGAGSRHAPLQPPLTTATTKQAAGVPGVVAAFNAFDTAAHHAASRKRVTAARRRAAAVTAANTKPPSGRSTLTVSTNVVDGELEDVPPSAEAEGGAFNIFDIDGIF